MQTEIGPFTFLHTYKVLIYRDCQFDLLADEAFSHMQKRHRDISCDQRHRIINDAIFPLQVKRSPTDLQGFRFPHPTVPSIPYLSLPKTDGLKCRGSPHVARQVQKIPASLQVNGRICGRLGELPQSSQRLCLKKSAKMTYHRAKMTNVSAGARVAGLNSAALP